MPTTSFTDGLAKLKPSGGHWAALAAESQRQVYRTERDAVGLLSRQNSAILRAPANTILAKPGYIFTVS